MWMHYAAHTHFFHMFYADAESVTSTLNKTNCDDKTAITVFVCSLYYQQTICLVTGVYGENPIS